MGKKIKEYTNEKIKKLEQELDEIKSMLQRPTLWKDLSRAWGDINSTLKVHRHILKDDSNWYSTILKCKCGFTLKWNKYFAQWEELP